MCVCVIHKEGEAWKIFTTWCVAHVRVRLNSNKLVHKIYVHDIGAFILTTTIIYTHIWLLLCHTYRRLQFLVQVWSNKFKDECSPDEKGAYMHWITHTDIMYLNLGLEWFSTIIANDDRTTVIVYLTGSWLFDPDVTHSWTNLLLMIQVTDQISNPPRELQRFAPPPFHLWSISFRS